MCLTNHEVKCGARPSVEGSDFFILVIKSLSDPENVEARIFYVAGLLLNVIIMSSQAQFIKPTLQALPTRKNLFCLMVWKCHLQINGR